MSVVYQQVEAGEANDLFTAPPKEAKWSEVTALLLQGKAVFIPDMTRVELETLRSIVNYRHYGRLRSRKTTVDGQVGRILRMKPTGTIGPSR